MHAMKAVSLIAICACATSAAHGDESEHRILNLISLGNVNSHCAGLTGFAVRPQFDDREGRLPAFVLPKGQIFVVTDASFVHGALMPDATTIDLITAAVIESHINHFFPVIQIPIENGKTNSH